jgi:hypothetical protein
MRHLTDVIHKLDYKTIKKHFLFLCNEMLTLNNRFLYDTIENYNVSIAPDQTSEQPLRTNRNSKQNRITKTCAITVPNY